MTEAAILIFQFNVPLFLWFLTTCTVHGKKIYTIIHTERKLSLLQKKLFYVFSYTRFQWKVLAEKHISGNSDTKLIE